MIFNRKERKERRETQEIKIFVFSVFFAVNDLF